MRSLIRSSGAVKVLAAAPATAPAEKRAASLGTSASTASGCLRSWDGVGVKWWCIFASATETQANLESPAAVAKVRVEFRRRGTWALGETPPHSRCGILCHEIRALSSLADMEMDILKRQRGDKALRKECVGLKYSLTHSHFTITSQVCSTKSKIDINFHLCVNHEK